MKWQTGLHFTVRRCLHLAQIADLHMCIFDLAQRSVGPWVHFQSSQHGGFFFNNFQLPGLCYGHVCVESLMGMC